MGKTQTLKREVINEQEKPVASKPSILDDAISNTRSGLISRAAGMLLLRPDRLLEMLRNVWAVSKGQPPLTDDELFVGVSLIAKYELDPTAKEIYVTRNKDGRLMTIIGIDGFVKILNRTPGYDGFEQTEDWQGKSLRSVTTTIWHKERSRPTSYIAHAEEYARMGGFVSKSMPIHMLKLFSLRHAIRLFTPIGGSVITEEEFHAVSNRLEAGDGRPEKRSDALKAALRPVVAEPEPEPADPEIEADETEKPAFDEDGKPVQLSDDEMITNLHELLADAKNIAAVEELRFEWADCSAVNDLCDARLKALK